MDQSRRQRLQYLLDPSFALGYLGLIEVVTIRLSGGEYVLLTALAGQRRADLPDRRMTAAIAMGGE